MNPKDLASPSQTPATKTEVWTRPKDVAAGQVAEREEWLVMPWSGVMVLNTINIWVPC